ncbi:gliding motility-associated C-terminal domain-containing protein [Hymenobacter monticola]|uniref:Gliding motility-associated C-terminal domain-containing protein n=1 Tax=Hymenobacter monticola TaxID=1705399 RepID=A0ABY4B9S8_9BACT|nr:gliding motility-associated C-terminal domain-containing protein [Hymenobacter monticola]UOE35042.1 gliding motility-associated C-terminal domain-containing protein [Hymenobacter monticola]
MTAAQAFGQASEHAGPANHTLEFIENKGQWDARARYEAQLPGGRLFAEADGLTFSLLADGGPARRGHSGAGKAAPPPADSTARGHALKLRFAGAAPATVTAETPTAEHRNYFLGGNAKRWAADVRSFRELRYAGLWPGVSARVYESADQHLEYDFVLAPGARAEAIALRHDGADGLRLDAAGNLLVRTSVGTLTERAPQAWQADAAGRRQAVPCRYVLTGQTVTFDLGKYDHRRPLTIDPVVVFATYTGATADNWGFTATYDAQGNLYSGGIVFDPGYPTSLGAYQTFFAGLFDIGVIKYNTSATGPAARVWATYLGGDGADFPHSLVVNSQGELLILGSTGSTGVVGSATAFPTTTGALQRTFRGGGNTATPFGFGGYPYDSPTGSDLIISRLSANGSALLASTYLGGSGNDGLLPVNANTSAYSNTPQLAHNYGDPFRSDIIVDAADNVYIATHTTSLDFPMARGFNSTYRGGTSDGVVCKLNPGLSALTWGSYLGGSGADGAYSIQLEPTSGDVYVAGGTLSPNFPTTAGAYRPTRPGNVDGFVTRIAANGTSVVRSTYVGTADYDQAYFLQLGTDGGVYLLGQTVGQFPVTAGLYNTPGATQFIQKLDANLGQSLLSTVFGSTDPAQRYLVNLDPTAFLVDQCDRVYVCGWGGQVNSGYPYMDFNGYTTGLPTTPDAAQSATDGSDFYLAQFSAGLTSLAYATFYGDPTPGTEGEHVDGGTSRFDPRGIVYQAVCSCFSTNGFPIPPGANYYSATNNSFSGTTFNVACNNASFVLNFQPSIANAGSAQTVCATAGPVALVGAPAGGVWSGPGVTGSAATGFVFTPSLALLGVQTLTYTVISTGACTTSDTRRVTVTPPPAATFAPLPQQAYCLPAPGAPVLAPVRLTGTPAGGTFSGPGVTGSVATGFFFTPNLAAGTYQLTYSVTANNCTATATQAVLLANIPAPTVLADTAICPGSTQAFRLRGAPAGGTFSGPGVTGSVATGFFFTPPAGFTGPATLTYSYANSAGCAGTTTQRITTAAVPQLAPTWAPVFCPETRFAPLSLRFTLAGSGIPSPASVVWDFGDGTQSTDANPTHTYAAAGTYRPLLRLRYNNNKCETQAALPVVEVREQRIPNIITPNGDDQNQFFRLGPDCPPRLQVFSRWGQQVLDAPAYRDDWKAEGQPDGVYYYLLTYPDGRKLKGWVEVVR